MSVTQTEQRGNTYALGRTPEEYERLRAQARMWDAAAGRLFDQVGLAPGAACLDAGCGPGETMRALAERVGPAGRVLGIDRDASLGVLAVETLHGDGHRQCSFREHDLSQAAAVPGGPFTAAFLAVGADVHVGSRLPELFRAAGVGAPDGTDVAGYLDPLPAGSAMLAQVFRSVLPVALAHGITTEENAAATLAAAEQDAARYPDGQLMWPLLVGAWKRKELA